MSMIWDGKNWIRSGASDGGNQPREFIAVNTISDIPLSQGIYQLPDGTLYSVNKNGSQTPITDIKNQNRTIKIFGTGDSKVQFFQYAVGTDQWETSTRNSLIQAEWISQGAIEYVGSIGHAGFTSSAPSGTGRLIDVIEADLLSADITPQDVDYIFVDIGANDYITTDNYTQRLAWLEALWQKIEHLGFKLIVSGITPHNGATPKANAVSVNINKYMEQQEQLGRWIYADYNKAIRNNAIQPNSVVGVAGWRANTTDDGLHPAAGGCYWQAKELVKKVLWKGNSYVPYQGVNTAHNSKVLTPNPGMYGSNASGINLFTADAGVSGTGPHAWRIKNLNAATVVSSTVASSNTDYDGNALQLQITAPAGGYAPVGPYNEYYFGSIRDASQNGVACNFSLFKRPAVANGLIYKNINPAFPSTQGASVPALPTVVGDTIDDGTVIWLALPDPQEGVIVQQVTILKIISMTGSWSFRHEFFCDAAGYAGTGRPKVLIGSMEKSGAGLTSTQVYSPNDNGVVGTDDLPTDIIGQRLVVKSQKIVLRTVNQVPINYIRETFYMVPRTAGATCTVQIEYNAVEFV